MSTVAESTAHYRRSVDPETGVYQAEQFRDITLGGMVLVVPLVAGVFVVMAVLGGAS